MTKEMCPSHQTDVLTHTLLYYGYRTKQKLRRCCIVLYLRYLFINNIKNTPTYKCSNTIVTALAQSKEDEDCS